MLLHQSAPNPGRKKYSPVTVLWQAGIHCIKSPSRFSVSLMETLGVFLLCCIQIKESPTLARDKTHTHKYVS